MLRLVAGTVLLLLIGFTEALAVEEIKKDNIGPWEIEATFKDNKFDHCAISRKVDDVVASFLRTSDGLSLTLESPNWKLERRKNYPVRMKAGAASWNTDVAAETNSVSVPLSDAKFKEGLRAASAFVVEGAGATIRIPLDQSRAALDRLDKCLTKNSRAVELFHDTLKDIYFAEKKILSTLPKMAKAAQNGELKAAFEKHRDEKEGQVERLDQVFARAGAARQDRASWEKGY